MARNVTVIGHVSCVNKTHSFKALLVFSSVLILLNDRVQSPCSCCKIPRGKQLCVVTVRSLVNNIGPRCKLVAVQMQLKMKSVWSPLFFSSPAGCSSNSGLHSHQTCLVRLKPTGVVPLDRLVCRSNIPHWNSGLLKSRGRLWWLPSELWCGSFVVGKAKL